MKKSIYYLIANTVSIIAAVIFLSCIKGNGYPVFDFSFTVTAIKDAFEPIKYVLLVEAASIILCTYDCVNADKKANAIVDILGAIITILTVLYTWVAVVLVFNNYAIGATIEVPFFLLGGFALCLVAIFASNPVAKKNGLLGGLLPFFGVLLMVAGLVCECLI